MTYLSAVAEAQNALRALFEQSFDVVAFTGAGISTESGVPDFRSADSPWLRNKPIDFSAFVNSPEARQEAWRRKFIMDDLYAGAKPSRGHKALASMLARKQPGALSQIITQNIDGLHQAAGARPEEIIELHGNGTYAKCLSCDTRYELKMIRDAFERNGVAPDCACGGFIKSATVSFGQPMPRENMRQAQEAAASCDLFLAIGSSLVVYPAATLPEIAKHQGAILVILNKEPTPLDARADLVIRADIGAVLEAFIA